MKPINYTAVRAFDRVVAPVLRAWDEADERESQFDGGEYSLAANDQFRMIDYYQTAEEVGERFGIEGKDLARMSEDAACREAGRYFEAQRIRTLVIMVKKLEYGTEAQINALNELGQIAYDHGLGESLEDFAYKASDLEIAMWVKHAVEGIREVSDASVN